MNIDKCKCPNCKNNLLYIQSKLGNDKIEMAGINVKVQYAVNCYWCNFEFGNYNSKIELLKNFNEKYGGSNVKNSRMES